MPLDDRRGRAARGLGLDARCPSTCARPTASSTRTAREQARGKDLEALKAPLRPQFAQAMAEVAADSGLARTGETTWVFGTIEASFTQRRAGHEVQVYPALVDEGDDGRAAGLRVGRGAGGPAPAGRTPAAAARARRRRSSAVLDGLDQRREARAGRVAVPHRSPSCSRTAGAAVVQAVVDARPPVRDQAAYDALRGRGRPRPRGARCARVMADVMRVLDAWRQAEKALSGRADMAMLPALTDMRAQLGRLVHRGFVGEAGVDAAAPLPDLPRRARAAPRRSCRAPGRRDRQLMDQIADLQEAYLHQVDGAARGPAARRRGCARCAGCSRSTASRCGPSSSARRPGQRPAHPT